MYLGSLGSIGLRPLAFLLAGLRVAGFIGRGLLRTASGLVVQDGAGALGFRVWGIGFRV